MSKSLEKKQTFDPHRLVVTAIDNALLEENPTLTQQELDVSRAVADVYEELRTLGYTDEEINAHWHGKTYQEIPASHAVSERKLTRRAAVSPRVKTIVSLD